MNGMKVEPRIPSVVYAMFDKQILMFRKEKYLKNIWIPKIWSNHDKPLNGPNNSALTKTVLGHIL